LYIFLIASGFWASYVFMLQLSYSELKEIKTHFLSVSLDIVSSTLFGFKVRLSHGCTCSKLFLDKVIYYIHEIAASFASR